ncbi:unnamed protein product [Effrenium voratum]|nr:unnamed protein product [Effrenium voratum]
MSQNQELHELRRQNGELREQNKIILQKAREYATYNRDAEARAQRSERSLRMLEGHAQDLTKQLAVLLYEKNRRENANLAASNLTFFSLSKDEDDKWPLSNVEEVVEQNVALRKALRHLEAKCEDVSSKVELEDREQQFEEELEKKSKELKELVSQLQEVQDALEEATHDRDAAVKKVKTLEAGIVPGNAPTSRGEAPQDDRELLRVKREREDLAERCQALQTQLSELRAAKAQAEKEESVGRARLEYERQLRRDLEESSKQLQREKKELTDRLNQQSKLAEDLREEKRHEEAKLRGTLSALKDVKAAQGNAESLLQAEELKADALAAQSRGVTGVVVRTKQMLCRQGRRELRLGRDVRSEVNFSYSAAPSISCTGASLDKVKLHASDAKELSSAQQRLLDLERGSQQLKLRQQDLVSEAEHAREERAEELISLRRRMEQAEEHARRLAEENSRYREQMVDFGRAVEGDAVREQVLAEMKKAREIGELERHRLELQKTQASEDGKALRSENQRLREQLAKEQRENWRLQKDCKLEQQSRAKLLQIDMIEDENCRLESENKALKEKLEDALKAADLSTNPLAKQLEEERKRREELEADRNFQKGRSEEWQSMYEGCKFKQSDIEKWEAQSTELNTKVTSLQESITSTQAELEKERSKVEGLTKDRDKTLTTLKTKEKEFDKQVSQLKAVQNLKELHTKRIQDLEAQTEQLKGDNERLKKEKGDKSDKMPAEDLLKAQKNADLAIHLAMEYWRALDAVLPEAWDRASAAPKEPAQARRLKRRVRRGPRNTQGVKRKEPIPLQQLGQAAERAPKLSRTDSGGDSETE